MDWTEWLNDYFAEQLTELDALCARDGATIFECFSGVRDPYLWNMLLWREYEGFENVKALLPRPPSEALQRSWSGRAGPELGAAVVETYRLLLDVFRRHLPKPIADCDVLDYGCGWGSVLRYLSKDVPPARLHGCDPHPDGVAAARAMLPGPDIRQIPSLPESLPFAKSFDVAYAISIWTHLSERASDAAIRCVRAALKPGGVLVATVRPPAYRDHPGVVALPGWSPDRVAEALGRDGFYFYPQSYHVDGVPTYGETILTLDYVRRRWRGAFELVEVVMNGPAPFQMILVLRAV